MESSPLSTIAPEIRQKIEELVSMAGGGPQSDLVIEDFSDIVSGEPIRLAQATPEELEDEDYPELPRISLGFDRRSYGHLRQLI